MCLVFVLVVLQALLKIWTCSNKQVLYCVHPVETYQSSTYQRLELDLTFESLYAFDDNITTLAHTIRSGSGWIYARFSQLICPYNITVINGKGDIYLA